MLFYCQIFFCVVFFIIIIKFPVISFSFFFITKCFKNTKKKFNIKTLYVSVRTFFYTLCIRYFLKYKLIQNSKHEIIFNVELLHITKEKNPVRLTSISKPAPYWIWPLLDPFFKGLLFEVQRNFMVSSGKRSLRITPHTMIFSTSSEVKLTHLS